MIVYLISLLVIGSAIAWSLWKAPSDKELWGEDGVCLLYTSDAADEL